MRPLPLAAATVLIITLLMTVPCPLSTPASGDFDPQVMAEVWRYEHGAENGTLWSVCWSPDGLYVAGAFFNNDVVVLNATNGEPIVTLVAKPDEDRCDGFAPSGHLPTRAVAWSPDGDHLAAGGDDQIVFVWQTEDWSVFRKLSHHRGSVQSLAWSNDGSFLASGSGTDKVLPYGLGENQTFIWNVSSATIVSRLIGHRDSVLGIAWSPDDARIATASDDRTARLWDAATGEELLLLEGHTSGVLDCTWSPDGTRLVTGSRDYKARLWDTGTGESLGRWSDNNCVRSVDWHPSENIVSTSGVDRTLKFRNATTGSVLYSIDVGVDMGSNPMKSRFDPSGELVVSGYGKGATIMLFGPVGSGPSDGGPDATTIVSGSTMLAISEVGALLIIYPAIR